MTNFNDRERGEEAKFAFDEENAFKIAARATRLAGEWGTAKGEFPRLHYLEGHNHLSPALSLGSSDKEVEELVARRGRPASRLRARASARPRWCAGALR